MDLASPIAEILTFIVSPCLEKAGNSLVTITAAMFFDEIEEDGILIYEFLKRFCKDCMVNFDLSPVPASPTTKP